MQSKNILHLWLSLIVSLLFTGPTFAAEEKVKEYGIFLIPNKQCQDTADILQNKITDDILKMENAPNIWHVSLYHGAFKTSELPSIKAALAKLNIQKLSVKFKDFYTSADRWVYWGIKKSDILQKLHQTVVSLASPYHTRPLNKARDAYDTASAEEKAQIDKYGTQGLMALYTPHMTLFYAYPANEIIRNVPPALKNAKYENLTCTMDSIVIGTLGYNGNMPEIIDGIKLK